MAININGDAPSNSSRTSQEDPERGGSTATSIFAPQTTAEIAERQRIGEKMWELRQTIRFVSREIFGTNNLRTYQMKALVGCLNPNYCESKMLFVTRTGYGKSHVMRTLGVVLGGVVVIFVPLLSLSADQMNKMKEANQNYGTVETHHLDEFPTDDGDLTLNNLVNRIAQLQDDTTSTIFLFTSPQFLCQQSNKPLLDELLSAHKRGVLRVVGIDEAHLFVQHSSFRVEIHMLTELFFKKVFDKERPKSHPVLLAMTATMPDQFIPKLEALIATRPPLVRPPELDHFEQRHIKMEFGVNCVSFVPELDRLVGVITDTIKGENHDASVRVVGLTTLASTAITLDEKLCEKLNKKKCDVDVVVVHGQLHKLDKFYNMRLFCAKLEYEHFRPRALVTNGAGNTGIDSENITEMLRAGWPMDLPTVFQERGRCARGIDMMGRIRYVTNIKSLVQCLYLLHGLQNSSSTDDVATNTNNRFGSAIQHASTASTETNESDVDKNVKKICQIRMARGSRELLEEKRSMLLEVMKFFCLDLGCYHLRAEYYLFHGKLVPVDKRKRCNGMCSICDGDWSKKHRRVSKRMLKSWFLSSDFTEPVKADGLTDMLWKGKKDPEQNREEDFWIKKIFGVNGKKSLKKYHVECLMQSLIAAEIITWKINGGKVEWWLNRVIKNDVPECCYSYDEYWEGIPLL